MSNKLKCYFAHPYSSKGTEDEAKILQILKERRIKVIDPFEEDHKIKRKFNMKEDDPFDYSNIKFNREVWIDDLRSIRRSNLVLIWIPEISMGVSAELSYALTYQHKIEHFNSGVRDDKKRIFHIQIITSVRHPLLAYALQNGNQLFNNIHDFDRMRQSEW